MIIKNIEKVLRTSRYVWKLATKEGFSNPFKGMQSPKSHPIYVLANGPSLKEFLEDLERDFTPYIDADFIVVNDFVHDHRFKLIKPKYYVISDPLFFEDTIYSERGHKAMDTIAEKVNWNMVLFIPISRRESKYLYRVRCNNHINIIEFHHIPYEGFETLRKFFYKKGLGNGEFMTVALNAIYIALLLNYKKLYVYGIDHTFFDNIAVNENNILCYRDTHFYGTEEKLKPMIRHFPGYNNSNYTLPQFLQEKLMIFEGHYIMEQFARRINAEIINCTSTSLVQAYKRKI